MNGLTARLLLLGVGLQLLLPQGAAGAGVGERLQWNTTNGVVSAEIQAWPLTNFLARLTSLTSWQIYLEPDTTYTVSAKFKEQPTGEALRLLLGKLNFALLPQAGAPPKLFVFRTTANEATQLIKADREALKDSRLRNELIVTLKPGQSLEELARATGAKVLGGSKGLNAYRLSFEDEKAADAAREYFENHSGVSDIDNNYLVNRPSDIDPLMLGGSPALTLKAKPVGEGNQIVVGLIDTAVQSLGKNLDEFVLPGISVAGETQLPKDQPTHGTAMAETILKGLALLLPEGQASAVRILPVDVYGPNAQTTTFDVGIGTYEAINRGANIINYSLGGDGDSSFLHGIIQAASGKGTFFVAAAGNEPGTAATIPAAYEEVFAVTAGDRKGNIAGYANSGEFVDGVAPGNALVSYDNRSYLITGTSASTAYASGYAAALADQSGKNATEVKKELLELIGVKKP